MNLTSARELKNLLDQYGFSFTKSLGQNFLIDQNIVDKIIRQGQIEGENVLEIGPGIGTMTYSIAQKAKKVLAIEVDQSLKDILAYTLGEFSNVKVHFADVLKTDIEKLAQEYFGDQPFKVVANLPYYITSPILIYLLKSQANISEIIVMMQKEVAQRIVADQSKKDYGSISVFIAYFGQAEILMTVPNTVFMPKPKVDSAVIKIKIDNKNKDVNIGALEKILRAAFGQRRKTILNSLSKGLGLEKSQIEAVLNSLEIPTTYRAENISLEEYLQLSRELIKNGGKDV
ncbi:MAG: 16S rRNA (adenine(1518)-N(6)/adenine(1519)-N(6))-dimethyltransferase RsmA [Bacillota bacterium]|nr:16S rRNA (adenine(1518)-N(6)/adenine(1519)-N(6))-dimethyltransferase RsmA [Bacillota bacterium]